MSVFADIQLAVEDDFLCWLGEGDIIHSCTTFGFDGIGGRRREESLFVGALLVDANPVDIDRAWSIGEGRDLLDVPDLGEVATHSEVSNDEVGFGEDETAVVVRVIVVLEFRTEIRFHTWVGIAIHIHVDRGRCPDHGDNMESVLNRIRISDVLCIAPNGVPC